ncbi:MAG: BMP family ABC transporter substrate-binding protein [Treponema sp.]|nr:BMP family ABC transporter substrate-binding protein [Treponema sp.]
MRKYTIVFLILLILCTQGCFGKARSNEDLSVLVFITGVIAGSPPYELMTQGAIEFEKNNPGVTVKIYEAGMNQALWEMQLAEMVSGGEYDVVIGSNPSLPEICVNVARMFPNQKFIITDADHEGNNQIRTYNYNQYEQSLFLGFLAGLITTSNMPNINNQRKIGFIAAQEFPLLTRQMVPGFLEGARLADPSIELDFRVVGSWADANKAAELTSAMINSGVDVFTSIAGGAAQGMIKAASDSGVYIVWYNTDAYNLAPGIIAGCGIMNQKELVMEILNDVLKNEVVYGISQTIGVKEGYLGFIFDHSGYQNLPFDIKNRFELFFTEYFYSGN